MSKKWTGVGSRTRWMMTTFVVALLWSVPSTPAFAETDEEELDASIKCIVRIEYKDKIEESFAMGPTLEESLDAALGTTCALPCAELIGKDTSDSDNGDLVEACVDECADSAIVVGTYCSDSDKETLYSDGAFSGDEEPKIDEGSKDKASKDEASKDEASKDEASKDGTTNGEPEPACEGDDCPKPSEPNEDDEKDESP